MIGCFIIHGYTGGPYEIEPLVSHLQRETDWEIVVPVLTGHGRELDFTNVSYKVWLEETAEALKELIAVCDQVYVIGFSMGGMIASYLAATQPVDKLILLAPARKYVSFKYLAQALGGMVGDGLKGTLQENNLFINYKNKFGEISVKANVEFMKLVHYTKPFLEKITAPVFIIQGQHDELVPKKIAYALEEEIGSAKKRIVLIEGAGHHLCLGPDKEVINTMVLDYLEHDIVEEK